MIGVGKLLIVVSALCICASLYGQEQKGDSSQAPATQAQKPQRVRLSQDEFRSRGIWTKKVAPEYPVKVRAERVQGAVVLRAVFDTAGDFKEVQIISGDGRLVLPAIKAVRQWKCKPVAVNDVPVEVETDITLTFKLN